VGCKIIRIIGNKYKLYSLTLFIVMLFNVTSALSGYISDMNYSRNESHDRDTLPYSYRMIGEGHLSVSTIDSKDITPHVYGHRATGIDHEGVK
jgi:hypothetical protein